MTNIELFWSMKDEKVNQCTSTKTRDCFARYRFKWPACYEIKENARHGNKQGTSSSVSH